MGIKKIEEDIGIIAKAHREHSIDSRSTRKWDNQTPYSIHPIWCAMTILHETDLPKDLRYDGALALLYHDVPEDTTAKLPKNLSERVRHFVKGMHFPGGTPQERKEIWDKDDEIKLLKLYDKISNLLDGIWINPREKKPPREYLRDYVQRLTNEVEEIYGSLNIVKIARAMTSD